ncbi:MAG: exo-alpha-sialidase [Ignavibacteriales bacterium]|nr:exo-alpha-sialidase [Ignavibacteriales bacterium]
MIVLFFSFGAIVLNYFTQKSKFEFTDWSNPILLDDGIFNTDTLMEINSLCISNNQESINGRILVTYKKKDGHYLKYSDDNGINWSEPIFLPLGGIVSQKYINSTGFSELKNGNVIFTYTLYNTSLTAIREIGYLASIDGITWDLRKTLFAWADYNFASINSLNDSTLILTAQKYNENSTDIVISYSNIDSINFIDEQIILSTNIKNPKPRTQIDNSGKIYLVYADNINSYENYNHSDIYYTTSTDNGLTWEASQKITNYLGNDTNPKLSLINDQPVLSFTSARNLASLYHQNNNSIYYGVVGVSEDLLTPPIHLLENIQQSFTYPFGKLIINETIIDDELVGLVEFNYSINSGAIKTIELFDDGNHNDQLSGDDIFGNSIDSLSNLDTVNYVLLFSDANTNIAQTMERRVIINNPQLDSTFYVDINNIKLPIDNKGNTADAGIIDSLGNNFDGGKFDESTFLFSGGFVLSGLNNGDIWANGMTSASRMEDYIPGKIGLENEQYDKVIYVVKSFDKPFGDSWHYWINAVKAGAEFYDGDGNGLYEPIDLNNNGIWDTNEDKPLIMGDLTAWCVYNDGVPAPLRKYNDIKSIRY